MKTAKMPVSVDNPEISINVSEQGAQVTVEFTVLGIECSQVLYSATSGTDMYRTINHLVGTENFTLEDLRNRVETTF